jgi:nucleoside-diphosphate-sugar epimerase
MLAQLLDEVFVTIVGPVAFFDEMLLEAEWILETLIGFVSVDVKVVRDPERMRPSEVPRLVGSYGKIFKDTGWRPEIGLERSLRDAFEDWVKRNVTIQVENL